MPITQIRQDSQIRQSDLYDDTLAAGLTLETGQSTIEGDLNAIRSQIARILDVTPGNWYDDVATVNGKYRSLLQLNTGLNAIEEQTVVCNANLLTDITIPGGQNYIILSVASSQTPSQVGSLTPTTDGVILVASALSGAGFAVHELIEVAGPDALHPRNLVLVKNATNNEVIQSAGRDVYALIQAESTFVDGGTINDTSTGNRVKLSFVRANAGFNDLEACPISDIENLSINYNYLFYKRLKDVDPNCWIGTRTFLDFTGSLDVTLDRAIDNQSGPATQVQDIEVRISDTFSWAFQDSTGASSILKVAAASGADEVEMNVDVLDINNTQTANFSNGAAFDTSGTTINIGNTAGQIDSAGSLVIASAAAGDIRIDSVGEVRFDDAYRPGSTWVQDHIPLADSIAEYDNYKTAFGEASLLSAIYQASAGGLMRTRYEGVLTANANADVNITGAGGTPNLSAQLGDYSALTFVSDVDVYFNGVLLRNGANAAANFDVYPGTTPANGDLKFEFKSKIGDRVTMVTWA